MIEERQDNKLPHNIVMEGRKNLSISGVEDIGSFDENAVVLATSMGELTIHGENLHLIKSDLDTGELIMDGLVYGFAYTEKRPSKESGGMFGRLFK